MLYPWISRFGCKRPPTDLRDHGEILCIYVSWSPLSMNPSVLDISITINPYLIPFSSIHHSFGITYVPGNPLQITNYKLSALRFGTFFFNLYYLTYCFCTWLCCFLYMLLFCTFRFELLLVNVSKKVGMGSWCSLRDIDCGYDIIILQKHLLIFTPVKDTL